MITARNEFTNPRCGVDTTGWAHTTNGNGAGTGTRRTDGNLVLPDGQVITTYYRQTWDSVTTGAIASTGVLVGLPTLELLDAAPGPFELSCYARCSVANRTALLVVTFHDAAGAQIGVTSGPVFAIGGAAWAKLTMTANAPAGTTRAYCRVYASGGSNWVAGSTLDVTAVMAGPGDYFDGATTDWSVDSATRFSWEGTAHASESIATTATLTATVDDAVSPPVVRLAGADFASAQVDLVWSASNTENAQGDVRGALGVAPTAGAIAATDPEPPIGVGLLYVAIGRDAAGDGTGEVVFAADTEVVWAGSVLFSDHFAQAAGTAVVLAEAELGTEDAGDPHYTFGSATPVVLKAAGAGETGTWELLTTTASQRHQLLDLLKSQPLVLVRPPAGSDYDWPTKLTVAIGAVTVARWSDNGQDQRRRITVSYTVQDPPGPSFAAPEWV